MNAPNALHLVCSTDDTYALPTAAMVGSVVASATPGRHLILHVLDGEMSPAVARRLRDAIARSSRRGAQRGVTLDQVWHAPDLTHTEGLRTHGHISAASYLRLQHADLLGASGFEAVERAVWLDSDLLVLRDLADLAAVDLRDAHGRPAPAGGIRNATSTIGRAIPTRVWPDPEAAYMNAGVMVLASRLWRAEGLGEAILSDLRDHQAEYRWHDQCGTNAVFYERWAELPEAWNVQVGSRAARSGAASVDAAHIVHFTGPWKPWQVRYAARAATTPAARVRLDALRDAWLDAARASGWFTPAQWVAFRAGIAARERYAEVRGLGDRVLRRVRLRAASGPVRTGSAPA